MKKTTSFGLGLAGGIVAAIDGLQSAFSGLFLRTLDFPFLRGDNSNFFNRFNLGESFFSLGKNIGLMLLPVSLIMIAVGILGIVGAVQVKKNSKTAGILMLTGAGLCVIANFNILVAGLLIAAGVLALIDTKKEEEKTEE